MEAAHRSVGGAGPGRRYATQQLNQAYAVLLSAQFQGFCRELYDEAADALVAPVEPAALRPVLREEFDTNRKLDRGNPTPGNIGADFNRLGLLLWPSVLAADGRAAGRRDQLEQLNRWRNAIAHHDYDPAVLGGRITLTLAEVRAWRSACNELARSFDEALRIRIHTLLGSSPW